MERLRAFGIFGALDDPALQLISEHLTPISVEEGETVFEQGDSGCSVYLIASGRVELRKRNVVGRIAVVTSLAEGAWFGEVAFLGVTDRSVTARACEATQLFELHVRDLRALYRHDLKAYALVMMNLARELSRKLQHTECRIVDELGKLEDD